MSIVLQGSTSGSVTLQEPAIAGTTVLDLPAVSGTVLTTGSSGQSIPKAALPTGSVLQVVSTSSTTTTSTSSTSFVTAGISASITPTSSSSKILVTVSGGGMDTWQSSNNRISATVYRNASTQIGGFTNVFGFSSRTIAPMAYQYLDSPATTSSTSYTVYFKSEGAYTVYMNSQSETLTITVMEIAA
jgi:hypothetical protein